MEDGHIPKDGELASGARRVGRPVLRFRDACKRDIKSTQIGTESWESGATTGDRMCGVASEKRKNRTVDGEENERRTELWTEKRERRRERPPTTTPLHQTAYIMCNIDCHSKTGLFSQSRCCANH